MADIFIGAQSGGTNQQMLVLKRANRHGLIAGATGTGKTITLQVMAEGFSRAGVPVFLSDVKGDLAGMALPGSATSKLHEPFQTRAADIGLGAYAYADTPTVFWDLFGEQGHPVRTTVTEMGPLLLARLLGLNETQEGVLAIAFKVADDQGMLLLDLKDLKQMLAWCADNAKDLATRYGNVTSASIGAIQRQLLSLESQGGDRFFGEPALAMTDMIKVGEDGRGQVNILAADKLISSPKLYATFLLWMLSELFEELPEVGDPDKPKLVFFFDEAHLLFDEAPKALLDKVEQVVRLIRSKGVGVYFITQNPIDVPDAIAGQLGNRVQHALRAFTPRDQKAVKAAATTFRQNPAVNVETAILELKTGEALVSLLMADGAPSPVERVFIRPPASRVGPLEPGERKVILSSSPVAGKYEEAVDRESAFEILSAKVAAQADAQSAEKEAAAAKKAAALEAKEKAAAERAYRNSTMGKMEKVAVATATAVAVQAGRSLVRGILGGLFKKR
ncbi:helicase HerA-like domain-containing protein [Sandaracinobacter sp.]|uniref:helicase HerA-like domain-containing protein n=1 Tax=Sandaracinobacter sp. TaxID=2487581 RepID=UPI0035B2C60D